MHFGPCSLERSSKDFAGMRHLRSCFGDSNNEDWARSPRISRARAEIVQVAKSFTLRFMPQEAAKHHRPTRAIVPCRRS
eukprot:2589190-Pyramimonas_sp.AAC.1